MAGHASPMPGRRTLPSHGDPNSTEAINGTQTFPSRSRSTAAQPAMAHTAVVAAIREPASIASPPWTVWQLDCILLALVFPHKLAKHLRAHETPGDTTPAWQRGCTDRSLPGSSSKGLFPWRPGPPRPIARLPLSDRENTSWDCRNCVRYAQRPNASSCSLAGIYDSWSCPGLVDTKKGTTIPGDPPMGKRNKYTRASWCTARPRPPRARYSIGT